MKPGLNGPNRFCFRLSIEILELSQQDAETLTVAQHLRNYAIAVKPQVSQRQGTSVYAKESNMTPEMVFATMPLAGLFFLIILPVILIRIWHGSSTDSLPEGASKTAREVAAQRKGSENISVQKKVAA
jgi:hypothetical protein